MNPPSLRYQEAIKLLFATDAEEEAAIVEAIEQDDRGESIPLEESNANLDALHQELLAEAYSKLRP